jgi:hypothetical protein
MSLIDDVELPFAMTARNNRGQGFQMAKAVADILRLIAELRPPPVTSTVGMLGRQSVIGQRLKAGPAQSRCRKGLRRSLAGVPCAADTGWVVQMAVLDHVLGERGVIETWPSSRRR